MKVNYEDVLGKLEGIRIKSVGWILLLVIPGAFVEPDEKQLQKAKRSTKLKVYAAGSFANIVIAFVIFAVFAGIFAASSIPSGLAVATIEGTPAHIAGLRGVITSINGHEIRNSDDLGNILSLYKPGDTVTVTTIDKFHVTPHFDGISPRPVAVSDGAEQEYKVMLADKNETGKAYLGVSPLMEGYSTALPASAFASVSVFFMWIYLFSLGIGIVNLLPLKPLDGGLLFEEIVGRFTPKHKIIVNAVSSVMLLMLLFNILGPIFL